MALPASGGSNNLSLGAIWTELGQGAPASNDNISIANAATGVYATINTNSSSYPNASQPHAVSEWGSYDHSASAGQPPAPAFTITFTDTLCRTDANVTLTDVSTGGTDRAWQISGGSYTVVTGTLGTFSSGTGGTSNPVVKLTSPDTTYTITIKAYNANGTDTDSGTQFVTPYLLEKYSTNIHHAVSLRKINKNITYAILAVRSSDSAEMQVGFVDDELDTAGMLSWSGSDTVYIKAWYDQSGNGDDFTQTSTSAQPRIATSGTLEEDTSGNIGIYFDGADSLHSDNNNSISGQDSRSVALVAQSDDVYSTTNDVIYGIRGTSTSSNNATWWRVQAEPSVRGYGAIIWENATNNWCKASVQLGVVTYGSGTYADHQLFWNGSPTALSVVGTPTNVNLNTATSYPVILGWDGVNANYLEGNICEMLMYTEELSTTNRETIEDDILAYYAGI